MTKMNSPTLFRFRAGSGLGLKSGFTTVEIIVAISILSVISMISYSFMRSGTILTVKSARLNHSHDEVRKSFDRLADHLLAANNVPTLIGTDGLSTTEPAAGLKFDKVIGDPYVLDPPLTAGSITTTTTSIAVWRSTNSVAIAPIPAAGDVLLIPTPTGNIRAQIQTATALPASPSDKTQKITLTFTAAAGKPLTWAANQPQIAKLVRPEAFIVMPVPKKKPTDQDLNELRFYPRFEPMPVLTQPANYKVLSNQIGTQGAEGKPFSIAMVNGGDRLVQSTLRVRDSHNSRSMSGEEQNTYSGYFQLLLNLPSRLRPKTTN